MVLAMDLESSKRAKSSANKCLLLIMSSLVLCQKPARELCVKTHQRWRFIWEHIPISSSCSNSCCELFCEKRCCGCYRIRISSRVFFFFKRVRNSFLTLTQTQVSPILLLHLSIPSLPLPFSFPHSRSLSLILSPAAGGQSSSCLLPRAAYINPACKGMPKRQHTHPTHTQSSNKCSIFNCHTRC